MLRNNDNLTHLFLCVCVFFSADQINTTVKQIKQAPIAITLILTRVADLDGFYHDPEKNRIDIRRSRKKLDPDPIPTITKKKNTDTDPSNFN